MHSLAAFQVVFLRDVAERLLHEMQGTVAAADPEYLLNVDEATYVQFLASKHGIAPLEIAFDRLGVSDDIKEVVPRGDWRLFLDTNSIQVFEWRIPYSGNEEVFSYSPPSFSLNPVRVKVGDGFIRFETRSGKNDPIEVKAQAEGIARDLQRRFTELQREIEAFSAKLHAEAERCFKERKAKLLEQSGRIAQLGVPVYRSGSVPDTFTVPVTRRTLVIERPPAPSGPFQPEFALNDTVYGHILRIIFDMGQVLESHPSTYEGKDEEGLRDSLLLVLSPHFQSASGETFHKAGKTDILIQHEGKCVFVAECKFWDGLKSYKAAIDQLLGYLTWRDSKTALVCFVRNREIGPVLAQIEEKTAEHPCFVRFRGKQEEGWHDFDFHLPEDSTRGVRVNVLCFHLPETLQ